MLRIVMDSAGDMPEGWSSEYDIQVIPINIHFGEKTYLQGKDISNSDFYRMADQGGVIPKTSQPSPQQFINFYEQIAQPGDTILSLHVTGKLSGTLASAQMAARELADKFHIFPVDSESGSASMGLMCQEARLMERSGKTVDQILDRWRNIIREVSIVLTLDTLEYARKSGRVKALQAALASVLNVKPIVTLREGALEVSDRVRTRRRSLDYVIDVVAQKIGTRPVNAAVVHAEDQQSGNYLLDKVQSILHCSQLIMTELSIGIAANLGPGTVGLITYPVEGG